MATVHFGRLLFIASLGWLSGIKNEMQNDGKVARVEEKFGKFTAMVTTVAGKAGDRGNGEDGNGRQPASVTRQRWCSTAATTCCTLPMAP